MHCEKTMELRRLAVVKWIVRERYCLILNSLLHLSRTKNGKVMRKCMEDWQHIGHDFGYFIGAGVDEVARQGRKIERIAVIGGRDWKRKVGKVTAAF